MSLLRQYLNIVTESELFENPYQGADAEKFAALTPADQEFLTRGGGVPDINDENILARAPNKGQPVATAAPVAEPAAVPAAAPAVTPAAEPAVTPAATTPKNRDTMSFGQAFADARKGGEKTFTWRGKPYTTDVAKPKPANITTTPKTVSPSQLARPSQGGMQTIGADPMTTSPQYKQLLATLNATFQSGGAESPAYKQAFANFNAFVAKNKPVSETTSFTDDSVQRIVSLVHYR